MPKNDKVKVNVKEKVDDNVCDLSLAELNEVPVREIAAFKRVNILDLSSNRLVTLGKNFVSLTRLVKLDLSKNQIKYLPDDFGLLRNLRHLDLYDNSLEHLPLSFGDLINLRYLDLKGNPLMPALVKIVGLCLTTKECQDAARNTVKFLAHMQTEAEKAKAQYRQEMELLQTEHSVAVNEALSAAEKPTEMNQKTKKSNKKSKPKNKKSNSENAKEVHATALAITANQNHKQTTKTKKTTNIHTFKKTTTQTSTALTSLFTFFVLLAINIVIIYLIMFKNPEIADKLVEFIPQQYRDWILTKTEVFRLRVTDWISEFRTPPEEH